MNEPNIVAPWMRKSATLVVAILILVAPVTSQVVAARPEPSTTSSATAWADLPESTAEPDAVRADADDILADPRFKEPPKSLMQRASEWFFEKFAQLIASAGSGGAVSALGWVLVLAFVAVIAFFVVRLGRTVRPDPEADVDVTVEVRREPHEWRRLAEQYEARGEWKEALRCRYRALLGDLVERRLLRDIPGRTVGEYRRDFAQVAPGLAPAFADASELFERAWYGDLPTGVEENRRFRQLESDVLAGTDR
ncbi:MAG: DUF4129 domain-containing protein [Acidimicrobiales bacterium]|nr:DUF4129 domain-containing protein [Acidimicrobiales bacterium]